MHAEGATGMIALGKRLTQLRRERGVTQEALAQHVGVTKAAVSKWENGAKFAGYCIASAAGGVF